MKKLFPFYLLLGLLCVGCNWIAYLQPMWSFKLEAPQYPQGLQLQVYMTGAAGDVAEIDIINHYIGMQKLELAAQNEKELAPYALMGLSLIMLLLAYFPNRRFMRYLSFAVLIFPFAFMGIFYLWLYRFGHDLNQTAPVQLTPFTPTMLGTGMIGQFTTFALPGMGFYLLCIPALLVLIILKRENHGEQP